MLELLEEVWWEVEESDAGSEVVSLESLSSPEVVVREEGGEDSTRVEGLEALEDGEEGSGTARVGVWRVALW